MGPKPRCSHRDSNQEPVNKTHLIVNNSETTSMKRGKLRHWDSAAKKLPNCQLLDEQLINLRAGAWLASRAPAHPLPPSTLLNQVCFSRRLTSLAQLLRISISFFNVLSLSLSLFSLYLNVSVVSFREKFTPSALLEGFYWVIFLVWVTLVFKTWIKSVPVLLQINWCNTLFK